MCTSSFVRCERIRNILDPVSSIWICFPSASQHTHDPDSSNNIMHIIVIVQKP